MCVNGSVTQGLLGPNHMELYNKTEEAEKGENRLTVIHSNTFWPDF